MRDEFLTVASAFDWITPTLAFIQDLFNGPASDFGISTNAGWSRSDIKYLLKMHGIRTWGLMLNLSGDTLMFTVPKAQAKQAFHLLQRQGVPILHAPAEVINSAHGQAPEKRSFANSFEPVFSFLDNLDNDF